MRAARELSINQSLIKRNSIRSTTRMRGVRRNLDRILVPVMMFLLQERRERRLLNETLRRPAAEIEYPGNTRVDHHIHHVQHILDDVEQETVLFLEARPCNSHCETTIRN